MAAEGRGVLSSLFTPSATGLCKRSPYKGEKTSKPNYEWTARSAGGEALANTCPHSHRDHHRELLSKAVKHWSLDKVQSQNRCKRLQVDVFKSCFISRVIHSFVFLSVWSSIKCQILFISQPFLFLEVVSGHKLSGFTFTKVYLVVGFSQ